MNNRVKFWSLFASIVVLEVLLFAGSIWNITVLSKSNPFLTSRMILYVGGGIFLLTVALAIFWAILDRDLFKPLDTLSRGL